MVPEAVKSWLYANGYGDVKQVQPVGGGCINNGARLHTTQGKTLFLKTNRRASPDMFAKEAEGLLELRNTNGPRVPDAYMYGPDFILLEDLAPGSRRVDYWETFGRQLAALHHQTNEQFGFHHDNYLGSTPQCNGWMPDGYAFYAEQRLVFQAKLAHRLGLFTEKEVKAVESLAVRLPTLVPSQPASLLHGDLWSGNAITDANGLPAVIDPAAYYGWAEAELGMTSLFGGFPDRFYRAYEEARPLVPGWRDRLDLYNLYHLLNHLNLFGEGYYGSVMGILQRYR